VVELLRPAKGDFLHPFGCVSGLYGNSSSDMPLRVHRPPIEQLGVFVCYLLRLNSNTKKGSSG